MPKGQYPRFKKAAPGAVVAPAITTAEPDKPLYVFGEPSTETFNHHEPAEPELPRGWAKGAHLNVRNVGHEYRITLFPEEFDPAQPERCLRFTSPVDCQNWISRWYMRESHDPRAMR